MGKKKNAEALIKLQGFIHDKNILEIIKLCDSSESFVEYYSQLESQGDKDYFFTAVKEELFGLSGSLQKFLKLFFYIKQRSSITAPIHTVI